MRRIFFVFVFSPITPQGLGHHWISVECLRQVSAWWCQSPLHAEAGMDFSSCPRMLCSQPTDSTETQTHNMWIQSPMHYPLSHHFSTEEDIVYVNTPWYLYIVCSVCNHETGMCRNGTDRIPRMYYIELHPQGILIYIVFVLITYLALLKPNYHIIAMFVWSCLCHLCCASILILLAKSPVLFFYVPFVFLACITQVHPLEVGSTYQVYCKFSELLGIVLFDNWFYYVYNGVCSSLWGAYLFCCVLVCILFCLSCQVICYCFVILTHCFTNLQYCSDNIVSLYCGLTNFT